MLAARAFATRHGRACVWRRKAYRAAEVVAGGCFSFGVAGYLLRPPILMPVLLLAYVVPLFLMPGLAALCSRPALCLAGPLPRGPLRHLLDARIPRVCVTSCLLALSAYVQFGECQDDIRYAFGDVVTSRVHAFSELFVRAGHLQLLNVNAAPFVCLASNRLPQNESLGLWWSPDAGLVDMRAIFLSCVCAIWVVSAWWCIATLLELSGCCGCSSTLTSEEERESVAELACRIAARSSKRSTGAEEIAGLGLGGPCEVWVEPEVKFQCRPFPTGTDITLLLVLLDSLVCDLVTICILSLEGHLLLAASLLAACTAALALEAGSLRVLLGEVRETLRAGVPSEGFLALLDRDRGFQAPLSLVISVHAFPFCLRTPCQALSIMVSIGISAWAMTEHIYTTIDLGVE